jgi:DNA-binding CsgD family transcriptional regulator
MDGSISTFQNLLLEGVSDASALPHAMEYLANFCDAPTAQIIFLGDTKNILQSTIVGTVDQDLFKREEDYWDINPRAKQLESLDVGTIVRERDFITSSEIARDQAYQELLVPAHVGYFAGVILEKSRDQMIAMAIAQPYCDGEVNDLQTERFSHAIIAARPVLNLANHILQSNNNAVISSFGPQAQVAIVQADGTVLDHSPAFGVLLSSGLIRLDSFGQLDLLSVEANRRLAASIRRPNGLIGGRFAFARMRPDDGFTCHIMPIQKTNDIANRSGVAIVILEPLFQHRNLDKGLLADAFNLTDAECAVAERLYIGETIREIAEYRNVATSTVKTMLKSIMSKTDSRRQAEVVTKLSRLAFPAGR